MSGMFTHYGKGGWRNVYDPFGLWGKGGIWNVMGDTKKSTAEENAARDLANMPKPGDPLKAELDRQAREASQIEIRDQDRAAQKARQNAYGARGTVLTGPLGDYKGETKTILGN